jgi:hypothetical protein
MTHPDLIGPPDATVPLTPAEWMKLVYLAHCCSRLAAKNMLMDLGARPSELTAYLDHVRHLPFADKIAREIGRRAVMNDRRDDPRKHEARY